MSSGPFKKYVDLLDRNWLAIVSLNPSAELRLSGIGLTDSREKLESTLDGNKVQYGIFYPLPADKSKKTYKCAGHSFNVQDDTVVGFALTYTKVNTDIVKRYLGETDNEDPIVGQVYSMYDWELLGYTWKYSRLDLEISLDEKKLVAQTFYVGKKLSSWDD